MVADDQDLHPEYCWTCHCEPCRCDDIYEAGRDRKAEKELLDAEKERR